MNIHLENADIFPFGGHVILRLVIVSHFFALFAKYSLNVRLHCVGELYFFLLFFGEYEKKVIESRKAYNAIAFHFKPHRGKWARNIALSYMKRELV